MRGVICYYSTTGNTQLACRYIADKVKNVEFDLCDIRDNYINSFDSYDIVGFATFTDWWDVPCIFEKFLGNIEECRGKHAFVFNTYAQLSGKTLRTMAELVGKKGFNVISGHSLRTPGNYPPSRAKGRTFDDAPTEKELEGFNEFILELESEVRILTGGNNVLKHKIKIGLFNSVSRRYPRIKAKQQMGELYVNEQSCIKCGRCKKLCAYKAIELAPMPVFDNRRCYGCWACFNNCPQKAIYTKEIQGIGHYPEPSKRLKEKLGYI